MRVCQRWSHGGAERGRDGERLYDVLVALAGNGTKVTKSTITDLDLLCWWLARFAGMLHTGECCRNRGVAPRRAHWGVFSARYGRGRPAGTRPHGLRSASLVGRHQIWPMGTTGTRRMRIRSPRPLRRRWSGCRATLIPAAAPARASADSARAGGCAQHTPGTADTAPLPARCAVRAGSPGSAPARQLLAQPASAG
jgi:hypothetical protein